MDFFEFPLLNTPHLFLLILKEAARGDASTEGCAARLRAMLDAADEHPPVTAEEVLSRIDVLRRYLIEAQLIRPAGEGRFAITERGRVALSEHPGGFDTADLMVYPEFARFIRRRGRARDRMDPRSAEYDEGFAAYRAGMPPMENPYPADSVNHLAWENGWFEALDEDVT